MRGEGGGGGGGGSRHPIGEGEDGRDHLSKPAAEVIVNTRDHLPICREGVNKRAVVKIMVERGGKGRLKTNNYKIKTFRYGIVGGRHILTGSPPPRLSSTTSSTVGERYPRPRDAWAAIVGGDHPGIGWILLDTGGRQRFTTTGGVGTPITKQSRRAGKGRGYHKHAGPGGGESKHFGWRELRR